MKWYPVLAKFLPHVQCVRLKGAERALDDVTTLVRDARYRMSALPH